MLYNIKKGGTINNQNLSYPEPQRSYSEPPSSQNLKSITQLFKESGRIYRLKYKTLIGIVGLPALLWVLFEVLMQFLIYDQNIIMSYATSLVYGVLIIIITLFLLMGFLLMEPSLIYSLKDNTGINESYNRALKILGSFMWVAFLNFIIVVIGSLLIIPGILFAVWYSLAFFVLIFEEKKGFDALSRSKYLVQGNTISVLARYLVFDLIFGLGGFLVFYLTNNLGGPQFSIIINTLFQVFYGSFGIIYQFLIYTNLREIKGEMPAENQPRI